MESETGLFIAIMVVLLISLIIAAASFSLGYFIVKKLDSKNKL